MMRESNVSPNHQSYAAGLECLRNRETFDTHLGEKILYQMERNVGLFIFLFFVTEKKVFVTFMSIIMPYYIFVFMVQGLRPEAIFNECVFCGNEQETVYEALKKIKPDFIPDTPVQALGYATNLLNHLNAKQTEVGMKCNINSWYSCVV